MSPSTDLLAILPSYTTRNWNNKTHEGDPVFEGGAKGRNASREDAEVYLGKGKVWTSGWNWRASPLYMPNSLMEAMVPALIQVGTNEVMLDETLYFATRMKLHGRNIKFHAYPRMWHVFQQYSEAAGLGRLQAALDAVDEIAVWVTSIRNKKTHSEMQVGAEKVHSDISPLTHAVKIAHPDMLGKHFP